MISYDDKSITFNGDEYKLKGLNSSHIAWHLSEIYNVKSFLDNLSESYSFPNKIHYMSIAEGKDFDALLVDDKMFRYKKLSESDLTQVQDCLNKYAYATALVKINECSEVIGSGLYHKFTMNEAYDYLSESYNRLLENFTQTNEKGKLLESYNNINIYEGNNTYIRGIGNSRYEECWEDTFKHENIKNYVVESVRGDNNNSIITFIDPNGIRLEATYKNTNSKLIESGINIINFLKKSNLVESYRVSKLNEYHQPFTMKYATITSYDWNGNQLILNVVDMFGNSGTMPVDIKIPKEEFMKKYKKQLDEITKVKTFKDGVNKTTELMRDAAEDWDRFNRISNLNVEERNSENQLLSYKVEPFIPKVGDEPTIKKLGKNKFTVNVTDDEDNDYVLTYLYKGVDDIDDFIDNITPEIDEYDFSNKSDVIEFYQLMDDYGDVEKSYPKGKTNNNVRKVRLNVKESEGVQTTDIAPKLDQNVGTIKVTMKKKKDKLNTNDLLLNTINEQDEFYGARGFIKDEKGRYHFNDYYINESGKVVHKSKLNESFSPKPEDWDDINHWYNDDPREEWDRLEKKDFIISIDGCQPVKYSPKDMSHEEAIEDYLDNEGTGHSRKEIKFEYLDENSNLIKKYVVTLKHDKGKVKINTTASSKEQAIKQVCNSEKAPESAVVKVEEYELKESFNPTGYTKVIDAISAGIETDEDEEALQKYLQDIINYCRSIAEDYDILVESDNGKKYTVSFRIVSKDKKVSYDFNSEDEMFDYLNLIAYAIGSGEIDNLEYTGKGSKKETDTFTEGQKEADDAYYKVNDVALKLQEIKPLIKDNTEAEDLYTEIMIALNSLQMRLHDEKLNEDMTQSELLDRYKQAISNYLPKCKNKEDLISVLKSYLIQIEDDGWDELKENLDYEILDKPNDPEDFVVKDIPDDKLPVDLAKQGKCPYCTGPMSDEEYKLYGMCQECFENGVE